MSHSPLLLAGVGSTVSPSIPGLYGVYLQGDGLANLGIGQQVGRKIAIRDRCDHSGTLNTFSWFRKTDGGAGGYSGGTGGSVKVEVQTDNSGLPSGSLVSAGASATNTTSSASDSVMTYNLTTPPTLTSGTVYWYVLTQQDASPTVNWVSIDDVYLKDAPTPLQPNYADADRALYWDASGGGYVINRGHYPIFDLGYADGYHGGQSMIVDAKSQSGQHLVGGANRVRLNFTPSVNKTVVGANTRLFKQSGVTNNVVLTLKDLTGGGTTIVSNSFAPAAVTATGVYTSGNQSSSWIGWTFAAQTLTSGRNYALEMTSAETTAPYVAYPSQKGGNGFNAPLLSANRFLDGYWEESTNSGSSWTLFSSSTDYQPEFYFNTLS